MLDIIDGKVVYDKVDALRSARGWTIYELAQKAGVAPTTIYNWRDRQSSPSLFLLDAVCSAFGITVIDFLRDGDDLTVLTAEQEEVLRLWDTLTSEQKKSVLNLMKAM